jgi:WD40 repeat protein
MLASVGIDGTIRRWDAITGAQVGDPITGHTDSVRALTAWTGPGGPMLASADIDGTIRRWDAITGAQVGSPMTGHTGWVRALTAWTGRGGPMLASAGADGTIRRWDAITGAQVGGPMTGHTDWVRALAKWAGQDGPMLASASDDGTIRRWDATTGAQVGESLIGRLNVGESLIRRLNVGESLIGRLNWAQVLTAWTGPDGPMLASAEADGTIRRWDATTGAQFGDPMTGDTDWVWALATWTGPDGPMLASASEDGTIQRWDATTGVQFGNPMTGHTGSVRALATWMGPDGPMLASASEDGTIRRWSATTGAQFGDPMTGHTRPVTALVSWTSPDGYAMLASTSGEGVIRRWNGAAATPAGEPLLDNSSVLAAWTGPDGRTILASTRPNRQIVCWDAAVGALVGPRHRRRSRLARARDGEMVDVRSLTGWTGPDGPMLASGGADGTIRRWNATTGARVGDPMTGHTDSVHALATWTGPDGPMLASASEDGTIRRWNAITGARVGDPMTGHAGWVQALATWTGPDGPMLASGDTHGTIRRWNATTGAQVGDPMTGHAGSLQALATWTGPGGPTLVSGGDDGTIRRWNAITGAQVGDPMTGHTGSVQALATWISPDGPVVASAGADGTIRVWDADTGELLHRVLVEPIRLRGLADRPAARDLLDRGALTQVLANLLLWRPTTPGGEPGPSVVTFEGPWGTGKTTVMRLVESRIAANPESQNTQRQLSVAIARKILLEPKNSGGSASAIAQEDYRGALTAWFNPWAYQSSEQVWAGLARSITDAAEPVLYPLEAADVAQRYWLTRNSQRIDRFAVRRSLLLRVVSPLLGLSAITALATILINLGKLNSNTLFRIAHQRVTLSTLALAVAVFLLLAGILHTIIRYYGPASRFLPGDLIRGPVLSGSLSEDAAEAARNLRDPVYWAKSGYLHLVQEDTATTIRDLRKSGYDLVVFIDDLDRCSARTTAEVFEAINLFMSGAMELEAKFVIGLDPAVVAAHLDTVYEDLSDDRHLVRYGDDPSPGWAFLRKVVQLPVGAPRVSDSAIDQFLGAALDVATEAIHGPTDDIGANVESEIDKKKIDIRQPLSAEPSPPPVVPQATGEQSRTGSLERQPEILAQIRQRLAAQPERSAREAKRLLNVWQLYQRVLDLVAPLSHDEAVINRACNLVILAEIVTRWPAMQRRLHQSFGGRRGLQILAKASDDDSKWADALRATGLDAADYSRAAENLRDLLRKYEGLAVADLAARVL